MRRRDMIISQTTSREFALEITAALFESLLGHDIEITAAHGAERWRVDKVIRRAAHHARVGTPFDVYLTAPAHNDRQQGLRTVTLPSGDALEFFAVPIAATSASVSYEVIFN